MRFPDAGKVGSSAQVRRRRRRRVSRPAGRRLTPAGRVSSVAPRQRFSFPLSLSFSLSAVFLLFLNPTPTTTTTTSDIHFFDCRTSVKGGTKKNPRKNSLPWPSVEGRTKKNKERKKENTKRKKNTVS